MWLLPLALYLEADGLMDLLHSELSQEALVAAPEEPDVGDAVEDHGQPLQAQTEGPARLAPRPGCRNRTRTPSQYLLGSVWESREHGSF